MGWQRYNRSTNVFEVSDDNGATWQILKIAPEGIQGGGGGGGTALFVVREIPTGVINGTNTVFTLAYTPIVNTEQIYLNGLLQDTHGIDYSISGATITFLIPPLTGDRVLATYQR